MTATYDVVTAVDAEEIGEVFAVYDAVFGDLPDLRAWRQDIWDRHAARDGFRLARARDDDGLVGFAYGYTGQPGQWWTDQAALALAPSVAGEWLGGHFEVVSVGVLERARGHGVGRRIMECLCAGLPQPSWVLMTTADAQDPARHLYASLRWEVLGPGLRDGQVIMGRRP